MIRYMLFLFLAELSFLFFGQGVVPGVTDKMQETVDQKFSQMKFHGWKYVETDDAQEALLSKGNDSLYALIDPDGTLIQKRYLVRWEKAPEQVKKTFSLSEYKYWHPSQLVKVEKVLQNDFFYELYMNKEGEPETILYLDKEGAVTTKSASSY